MEKNKLKNYEFLPNGNIRVKTREGVFELREPLGEEVDAVERIAKNTPSITEFAKTMMIAAKCIVEPTGISELDLTKKYKISTCQRLATAVSFFIDEEMDFLWEKATTETSSSKDGNESKQQSVSDTTNSQTKSED